MKSIKLKTPEEIAVMAEGGDKLGWVKNELLKAVEAGVNAYTIDELAEKLILKEGGKPSFKMVPGYSWTTCVNINEGVVHGIPSKTVIFKKGDVVSIDVGMFYKGFHTDTSLTTAISPSPKVKKLLSVGEEALRLAIKQTTPGKRIYDISLAIEERLKKAKLSPIKALVGHGIGKNLHEEPAIPCFVSGAKHDSPEIKEGAVLAIEVMYAEGGGDVVIDDDGWTIVTRDGKISALYEETVAVTKNGPKVLTGLHSSSKLKS